MGAAGIGAAEAFFRLPFLDPCGEHGKLLIQIGAAAMGAFSFCGAVGFFEKFTYTAAFAALIFKNRHFLTFSTNFNGQAPLFDTKLSIIANYTSGVNRAVCRSLALD